jgi:hypothetical protein
MPEAFPRWAFSNISLPENRTWTFGDRPWLSAIYRSFSTKPKSKIVIPKSSQGGISTFAIAASFFMAIEVGGVNIGYYLPRQDDVSDIVETKVNVMLQKGSRLDYYLGKPSSVRTKKFASRNPDASSPSFIRFAEASVAPRIITLDMLVKDEFDLCNKTFLAQAGSRMDSSPHELVISMGVPYTGAIFIPFEEESTAQEWFVPCPHCGLRQIMEWELNFVVLDDGPQYICQSCGGILSVEDRAVNGEWVAKHPGRDVVGFHVSQFMYAWRSAQDLFNDSNNLNRRDFYALKLGRTLKEGHSLTEERALALLFGGVEPFEGEDEADGESMYYLGADQGNQVTACIVKEPPGSEQRRIVHLEEIPLADAERRIAVLMTQFGIRSAGIDAEPNKLLPLNLQRDGLPVWSITQSTRLKKRLSIDESDGRREITAQRTDIFDELFDDQILGGRWFLYGFAPNSIEVMDAERGKFIRHLAAMRREPGASRGTAKALWQNDGDAHYAHSLYFALVAMDLRRSKTKQRFAVIHPEEPVEAGETDEADEGEEGDHENSVSRQPDRDRYQRGRTRFSRAIRQVRRNAQRGSWPAHAAFRRR